MSVDQLKIQTVDAHGIAEAPFDRALFTLTTEVKASTAALAKDKLLHASDSFKEVFEKIKQHAGVSIDESSLTISATINVNQVLNKKKDGWVQNGFKGSYSVSFDLETPETANVVYDVLTELEGFTVPSPTFHLKKQETLKLKALKNAFDRARNRFVAECSTIGISPDDYEVGNWRVNYGSDGKAAVRMAAAYSSNSVDSAMDASGVGPVGLDIQAALAVVTIQLVINYVRKEK